MVCLQSLGSSINVLKTLGPLLEAGFTGREDKPQAVVDAFQDYWDVTFAKDSVPKGGWPSTVITCLKACKREEATTEPTSLVEIGDIADVGTTAVPMLEPAFNWGSSSTIAAEEDNASDVTMTSQDSNPLVSPTPIKVVPSTPEAATLAICSPQRPSKTATIRGTDMVIFSPLAQPTKLNFNFIAGTASPSSSPSRLPRSPLRSPKKISDGACSSDKENTPPKPAVLPSLLDRIAMASSPGTPRLGKRRASNVLTDSRPAKKRCGGHVASKSNDGSGGGDRVAETEDDSEAEREEVLQSLLSPATPSSMAQGHLQQHVTALIAFPTVPRTLLRPRSRSSSPTPQPPQHKRKRKSVFMDAVEILTPRPTRTLRKTRSTSSHTDTTPTPTRTREPVSSTSDAKMVLRPLSLSSSSGQVARRSLRRTKSLVNVVSGAGVSDRLPVGATPAVAQRAGKRQKVATTAPTAFLSLKSKKAWIHDDFSTATAANASASADYDDDDDVVATAGSSSPISAALKRARVLFGSGKSALSHCTCPFPFTALHFTAVTHCPRGLPSFFFRSLLMSL